MGPACVSVAVDGRRAPALDCINTRFAQALGGQGAAAAEAGREGIALSEQAARRPSNQLGLFNYAATANRMCNRFGIAVEAQRPPAQAPYLPALRPPR
ncbi:hypothetical protein BKK79_36980 (plasmid) [Cupriavidus sp. USMAA2-4]|uniref:hypothetical protein n=1 Tax=Cupriavidus sp. USMAA2-4 TaxID=876364 RepID=UPI0008A6BA5F|nr:hypothetical protein [Cupriavidus sp. USMAA2-4]AOY97537.1 hypothetical protein BKK79_36980 [Cupriavidus sp. USMAA2-4]